MSVNTICPMGNLLAILSLLYLYFRITDWLIDLDSDDGRDRIVVVHEFVVFVMMLLTSTPNLQ